MPNIYSRTPKKLQNELFEEITRGNSFKLERIVSRGHSTPQGKWYDQERDEWVILLRGSAGVRIHGKKRTVILNPGDYVFLPAHRKHRVEWTQAKAQTIWLALHFKKNFGKGKK
jgi:cupin 2 domain-containing protein